MKKRPLFRGAARTGGLPTLGGPAPGCGVPRPSCRGSHLDDL